MLLSGTSDSLKWCEGSKQPLLLQLDSQIKQHSQFLHVKLSVSSPAAFAQRTATRAHRYHSDAI